MNLSDLRVFKAVVECGGVTKAAARVHRVQSNLTARIQHLEQDLGRQLFDRAGRRMVLTPEGRRLYASADRLLTLADEVKREIVEEGVSGVVRIGAMESTAATRLPALLAEFHACYPGAQLELTTGTARALTDRLIAGDIDLAFAAGELVSHEALAAVAVFNEELVLVLPPGEGKMDMAAASMVSFTTGCAYRRIAEGWFREQGGQVRQGSRTGFVSRHPRVRRRRRRLRDRAALVAGDLPAARFVAYGVAAEKPRRAADLDGHAQAFAFAQRGGVPRPGAGADYRGEKQAAGEGQ